MKRLLLIITSVVIVLSLIAIPMLLSADGGPMVDPTLFAKLKEGQQVAVIRLQDTSTISVDLFVSILDQTGESHDISYFVPLGTKPSGFQVNEEDSLTFAHSLTETPDRILFQGYRNDQGFIQSLFAGALLTNGVWLTPLWLPVLLSSCGAAPTPVSSFSTPGSQVDVFNIDETTDLDALISTTGLDASVKDTLSRLKGQQIAVIQLKTSPVSSSEQSTWNSVPSAQPGLHLSWVTPLTVSNKSGMTYAYPLGTGASWANPIEMTRVYVIAPLDINFNVQYPKLGVNRSGFSKTNYSYEPLIASDTKVSAYAVDEAIGQNGYVLGSNASAAFNQPMQVWLATFTNSNSTKDMLITVNTHRGITVRTQLWQHRDNFVCFIIGLVIAILFWMLAWYFIVPRIVGKDKLVPGLWRISLTYIVWNLVSFIPGAILWFAFYYGARVLPLVLMFILFGGVSALIFSIRHMNRLAEVKGKAIQIFAAVTLVSGGAYLLVALGYAWLAKAI